MFVTGTVLGLICLCLLTIAALVAAVIKYGDDDDAS